MAGRKEHIPAFPPSFGEDKGEFFKHYDKIQDDLDNQMVHRLKDYLDGILIFAGLFAGVNSAFITLTLVLMKPDPLDDISTLLQRLVQGLTSTTSLPSLSFTASFRALVINGFFVLSLSSALFAALFAVLGRQWLMFYHNNNGGGVDQQRWEQLRRSLGAERWNLVPMLEVVLPVLIQTALSIFTVGVVLLLRTMSQSLSTFVLVPLVIAVFLSLVMIVFSLWDTSCPFRTPLSEIVRRIPRARVVWRIPWARVVWRIRLGVSKTLSPIHGFLRNFNRHANRNEGVDNRCDEETGNGTVGLRVRSVQESPVAQGVGQPRSGKELWKFITKKRRQAMLNPEAGLRGFIRLGWLLQLGREVESEQLLQIKSIMRVIKISEDSLPLYHAALNLRSITDLTLLALVCADETTTRGLRECYSEALEELDNQHSSTDPDPKLLRNALAYGTAFLHTSLSARSFDEFIAIMGMKSAFLQLSSSSVTPKASQRAGAICRRAGSLVRKFMNLQLRQLGAQPVALTSTTLAATALWYAINGIPHSQDIVYGDRFRDALTSSDVSWAGLGLLASVSNLPCKFEDVRQRKPYGVEELDWCRLAFLRVRDAYHLSGPTKDLADAIHASLSSGRNLETNAILFKFSWKLFTRGDGDEDRTLVKLGERALSAGEHLIRAIEESIRSPKKVNQRYDPKEDPNDDPNDDPKDDPKDDPQDDKKKDKRYQKYAGARAMCFNAMIEHMGPRGGQIKTLKRVAWRQRLVLMTATAYMKYIMDLQGRRNKEENAHVKDFMKQIREAQPQALSTLLTMGKEYADAKREFETTFSKFVGSGQFRRRLAPEEQWCFT